MGRILSPSSQFLIGLPVSDPRCFSPVRWHSPFINLAHFAWRIAGPGGANYLRTHASIREAISHAQAGANFSSSSDAAGLAMADVMPDAGYWMQLGARYFHCHVQFINIILSIFTAVQQQQRPKDNVPINSTVYHIAICCLFAEGYADLSPSLPRLKKRGTSSTPRRSSYALTFSLASLGCVCGLFGRGVAICSFSIQRFATVIQF